VGAGDAVKVTTLALCLFLAGCPSFLPAIQGAINAAQWVGSIIDVADDSQKSWFKLNPNGSEQEKVEIAMFRARRALSALNGLALASKSVDEQNMVAARRELLDAYKNLEALFLSLSVPLQPGMKAATPPKIVQESRVESALAE